MVGAAAGLVVVVPNKGAGAAGAAPNRGAGAVAPPRGAAEKPKAGAVAGAPALLVSGVVPNVDGRNADGVAAVAVAAVVVDAVPEVSAVALACR